MQGETNARITELGWPGREPERLSPVPPCGDRDTCVCWPDDRVTVADMERLAAELGMSLSDLLS